MSLREFKHLACTPPKGFDAVKKPWGKKPRVDDPVTPLCVDFFSSGEVEGMPHAAGESMVCASLHPRFAVPVGDGFISVMGNEHYVSSDDALFTGASPRDQYDITSVHIGGGLKLKN